LRVRLEPTQLKNPTGVPLKGRLLALLTNIKQGWKSLPGTKNLVCNENSLITVVKSVITLGKGNNSSFLITVKMQIHLSFINNKQRKSKAGLVSIFL
jgi:hypothetical protein